eukprot:tig00021463_g21618.t1
MLCVNIAVQFFASGAAAGVCAAFTDTTAPHRTRTGLVFASPSVRPHFRLSRSSRRRFQREGSFEHAMATQAAPSTTCVCIACLRSNAIPVKSVRELLRHPEVTCASPECRCPGACGCSRVRLVVRSTRSVREDWGAPPPDLAPGESGAGSAPAPSREREYAAVSVLGEGDAGAEFLVAHRDSLYALTLLGPSATRALLRRPGPLASLARVRLYGAATLWDAFLWHGRYALVYDYYNAPSLGALLQNGRRFPAPEVASFLEQAALTLHALRDAAVARVGLDPGRVLVLYPPPGARRGSCWRGRRGVSRRGGGGWRGRRGGAGGDVRAAVRAACRMLLGEGSDEAHRAALAPGPAPTRPPPRRPPPPPRRRPRPGGTPPRRPVARPPGRGPAAGGGRRRGVRRLGEVAVEDFVRGDEGACPLLQVGPRSPAAPAPLRPPEGRRPPPLLAAAFAGGAAPAPAPAPGGRAAPPRLLTFKAARPPLLLRACPSAPPPQVAGGDESFERRADPRGLLALLQARPPLPFPSPASLRWPPSRPQAALRLAGRPESVLPPALHPHHPPPRPLDRGAQELEGWEVEGVRGDGLGAAVELRVPPAPADFLLRALADDEEAPGGAPPVRASLAEAGVLSVAPAPPAPPCTSARPGGAECGLVYGGAAFRLSGPDHRLDWRPSRRSTPVPRALETPSRPAPASGGARGRWSGRPAARGRRGAAAPPALPARAPPPPRKGWWCCS